MNNTQKTFAYFLSISVLLMFPSLAYGDNDSSLSKQIEEAIVLSAGPKTELGVLNAERGYFEEDRISTVSAGTGFYIDSSSVTVGESEQEAVIAYRFGNEADAEITGEWLEIIATTDGWSIEWTCQPADENSPLKNYLPASCQSQAQKQASQVQAELEAQQQRAAEMAALPKAEALEKQVEEAIVLSAGPKTELGVLNAERGYFEEDRISTVSAGTGFYIDSSSVTVGESEQEAVIAYRFGNEADAEITGEWLEIIATTDGWSIEWTCQPADGSEKLNDYLPNACDPI